jgi:hypothetical protein
MDLLDGERERREESLVRSVDAIRDRFGDRAIVVGKVIRYLEED